MGSMGKDISVIRPVSRRRIDLQFSSCRTVLVKVERISVSIHNAKSSLQISSSTVLRVAQPILSFC
eukprot:5705743-Pyramimonas_sp.AAC.1